MCDEEETLDIRQQLDELLTNVQPNLQDVIKRSFTNVALQQSKICEQQVTEMLEDTSYFSKNTQVNLSRLELLKVPTFHVQSLSLDMKSMGLSLRCSLGDVNLKGVYSAYNENLYNLIPVLSEGHLLITLANMTADVNVGLMIEDDAYSLVNPGIQFIHDEVIVKLSWPSPNKKTTGYDFTSTEQLAKHIDDLPLSAAISLQLHGLLRRKLLQHLALVLRQATSVSEVMCCNPRLLEAYSEMANDLIKTGNRVMDMLLINMRRTLLQGRREVLKLPPLNATFLHKVGLISFVGKFETEAGWLKNLATVNRVSDVSMVLRDPHRTSFHVTLSVKDLQMGFDAYWLRGVRGGGGCGGGGGGACGGGEGGAGRVAARVAHTALHAAVTLRKHPPHAQLDHLQLDCMDGMELHVTGAGVAGGGAGGGAGGAGGALGSWLRGSCAGARLLQQLTYELRDALATTPLHDIIQGY